MGNRIAAIAVLLLSGCAVELQHDLTEQEANEIYVALFAKGLNPAKVRSEGTDAPRFNVTIPKQEVAIAFETLQRLSLPRTRAQGLGVFKATKGMIPTATEERAMFLEALGGEIGNALSALPGALDARVIVNIPETNDLTQPDAKSAPSAAVVLKYLVTPNKQTFGFTEAQVKEFVGRAVPELKAEAITVLMAPVSGDDFDETKLSRSVETLTPQLLKTLVVVLASLLLLATGFIAYSAVTRRPMKVKAEPAVPA